MREGQSSGGYHQWTAFLRCPDCGQSTIALEYYPDGTLFRCEHCGTEAWAAGISENERRSRG